jgi:rhodanese-related sulfurtransferase
MSRTISRQELVTLIASSNPPVLLEALPAKYFDDWHLPGARNMPHDQVRQLAPRLAPNKGAAVVVYCANAACQNSHIAAGIMGQIGYTDVRIYAEGKKDWQEAGLPVEQGNVVTA